MISRFDPSTGAILIQAELWGPVGSIILRLALDTGATRTTINHAPLVSLGYDPSVASQRIQVTMGGTVEFSPVINVSRIDALGCYAETLSIFAHTLPPSAGIDGVLGLDFFRRRRLIIDFTTGEIEVT